MLRVILEPLIGNIPLVGAVTMFFIRRPVSVFCLMALHFAVMQGLLLIHVYLSVSYV